MGIPQRGRVLNKWLVSLVTTHQSHGYKSLFSGLYPGSLPTCLTHRIDRKMSAGRDFTWPTPKAAWKRWGNVKIAPGALGTPASPPWIRSVWGEIRVSRHPQKMHQAKGLFALHLGMHWPLGNLQGARAPNHSELGHERTHKDVLTSGLLICT